MRATVAAQQSENVDSSDVPASADPETRQTPSTWDFRLAVLKHHKLVYRVALAMLRNPHEAEDVTQDVFMRYWQHGGRVERPKEWLLRVSRNACLDRLRTASRRGIHVVDTDVDIEADGGRDPAWHCEQSEIGERLHELIGKLPEPQRSLVILFDIQGVNGATCARILDINVNQVKVYLHRARRRLRRELEQAS